AVQKQCVEKIGLYLKGAVGIRPLVDLNGYYLLVMNKDPSITVLDPMVSMAGRTSTLTTIKLKSSPMDWVNHDAQKLLYVSMPAVGELAVVDTETFKVTREVAVGEAPTRTLLQPDGRYLWIGNNARDPKKSGVTVVDTKGMKVVLQAATGRGHHEIAISSDNRLAFVTNRDDNTVTVFDVGTLKQIKQIKTGELPLSIAYSALSRAAYVANGKDGTITVIDAGKLEVVKTIKAKPGLGPLRMTPDGRFAMVVNTMEGVVNVIDPGTNEIIQSPQVKEEPFQIAFTRGFAYVRSLGSERVSMINLASLGQGKEAVVQSFAAGSYTPKMGGDLPLADTVVGGLGEAAAFVVSPADNTTYFYMEGMNAPMSSYPSRGSYARAVTVVDRSLREIEPGVFAGRFRMPVAGHFDVALSLDQPSMVHCFSTDAKADPQLEAARKVVEVEFLPQQRIFRPQETGTVRFRILEGTGVPKTGLRDVLVRSFMVPASPPSDVVAKEVGDGIYEARIALPETGAYYVYISVPSLKLGYSDGAYLSLMAKGAPAAPASTSEKN
ncbi:MAG TPA: cytochrome D1 domain-containing protein, partial [Rhodocyclaceae bacterium]